MEKQKRGSARNSQDNHKRYFSDITENDTHKKPVVKKNKTIKGKKRFKGVIPTIKDCFNYIFGLIKKIDLEPILKDKKNKALIITILSIFFLASIVAFMTRKNAYAIYIGSELTCYIKYNKNITENDVLKLVENKIKTDAQTDIKIKETLELKKAHASNKDMLKMDDAATKVYKNLTYQVQASIINVDGNPLAILKTEEEANKIIEQLYSNYQTEGSNVFEKGFLEKVEKTNRYVELNELYSEKKAFDILTSTTKIDTVYVVVNGDNLHKIATKMGMTISEILDKNDGMTEKSILKIGKELNVTETKPIVSVKIVEERKYTKPIPMSNETRENPIETKDYRKTVQEGKDGQEEITEHTTKINGKITKVEIINSVVKIQAVTNIVEVGTETPHS